MQEKVNKTILNNGLRIVTESIPNVRSLSVGIWIKSGSRNESVEMAGITHFLEHMLFKGTVKRSAFEIARSLEAAGGHLNAFTSSEYTCYYARCLDTDLELAVDVLTDMVLSPVFPQDELQKEIKVVLEEMKMYKDNPDDYIFEEFTSQLFNQHPLGRPIIGYDKTVSLFNRDMLLDYMNYRYLSDNIIISVAGNTTHNEVIALVEKYYTDKWIGPLRASNEPLTPYNPSSKTFSRKIEQTHYIIGKRSVSNSDANRYKLLLANTVLGGGMSSRLHQNIREKYGYCYAIQSFNHAFTDTGIFGVYVGTDKENLDHVKELILKEFDILRNQAIQSNDLNEAKSQLKGKLLLAQESMSNRMTRLAKSEIFYNRYITLDELIHEIDDVNAEDIRNFCATFLDESLFSETRLLPE